MAGLVFLADFFGWTAQEAVEAYIFRTDVQYALNLEPGVTVSTRTLERYQKTLPRRRPRRSVFDDVTTRLAEKLELDVSRQRLDSTHVFQPHGQLRSHQAHGRGDQAVLDPGQAARPRAYAALPEDFRRRYEPAESQLFADAKDAEARQRSRQQAAEDLLLDHRPLRRSRRHDEPIDL